MLQTDCRSVPNHTPRCPLPRRRSGADGTVARVVPEVYSSSTTESMEVEAVSQIVVIGFDTESQARDALKSLRGLEKEGRLSFEDTAVVTHGADGKIDVKNEMSSTTEAGAVVGAVLGGVLLVAFPIAGIALGAVAGGGIGASLGHGIDGKFVDDVKASLPAGRSALFLQIKSADRSAAIAVLRQYHGEVIQTSLDEETEEALRDALK
jgi:uncharacterized membrane protein